jgi:integrase
MSTDAWTEEYCISGTLLPRLRRTAKASTMPIPYAPTCARRSAALATYAENRDCLRCPDNSLSVADEGRNLPICGRPPRCRVSCRGTIRNDLSECSAIWTWGVRNGKTATNPFAGISPPKERGNRRQRRAFTEAEAVTILTAARANRGFMRWLPWVCCLTGARISEICQATKDDVDTIDGIADEGDADDDSPRSLKNEDSRRNVPVHPALIAEGFLAYVAGPPARSPLFPDAKPDRVCGIRATNAGKKVSRWLKLDLKITDERISPTIAGGTVSSERVGEWGCIQKCGAP